MYTVAAPVDQDSSDGKRAVEAQFVPAGRSGGETILRGLSSEPGLCMFPFPSSLRFAALLIAVSAAVFYMNPPLLRTIGLRAFSMATEVYKSGSVSAAYVTCPNETVAKDIARGLVERKLAACVNIIPQITSIYEWKGKIEEDSEILLMIKTRSSKVPAVTDYVRSVHPYEVCEVISVPIEQGNPPYLSWITDNVPE
ncbi:protein CutA isoform X3 [Dendrobates tinctorius]|uniref:protein CutA isoform X3 n=1 Tax=Dendrobates tinctorius TaxID=92724 RepID=UPI003CC99E91